MDLDVEVMQLKTWDRVSSRSSYFVIINFFNVLLFWIFETWEDRLISHMHFRIGKELSHICFYYFMFEILFNEV